MLKVQVHDGVFHEDDATFVALVMIENGEDIEIVRNRNPLDTSDIIGDTGMIYDPWRNLFDHHQDTCPVYDNGVKYSAAGLYLKHMKTLTDYEKENLLNNGLYGLQANDNGQIITGITPTPFGFVKSFNTPWDKGGVYSDEQNERFRGVVNMVKISLDKMIESIRSKERVVDLVLNAIDKNDPVVYLGDYVPWNDTIIEYNKTADKRIKVVVYVSPKGYYIQVVPVDFNTFESYVKIPQEVGTWDKCSFLHKERFLAVFDDIDTAMKAAHFTAVEG